MLAIGFLVGWPPGGGPVARSRAERVVQPWPARGPPELAGSKWNDDDQRCPDDEVGTTIEHAD